jgi:MarR family transcriptional regulator, 2-MHQ and catechol-resistance regulon repressor
LRSARGNGAEKIMQNGSRQPSQVQHNALKTYVKLMRAANSVTRQLHAYLADYKLTLSQFGVLEALYSLGPMHQREIADKILKTDGNITMVLNNLARRGLITREPDAKDRRCQTVALSREGMKLIAAIFPVHMARAECLFACLNREESEALGAALKKLGRQAVA